LWVPNPHQGDIGEGIWAAPWCFTSLLPVRILVMLEVISHII